MGTLCKSAAVLKIVESSKTLAKLYKDFGCQTLNTLIVQKAHETSSCHSSVLIEQDFRVRPPSQQQMQTFISASSELFGRTYAYLGLHGNPASIDILVSQSQLTSK